MKKLIIVLIMLAIIIFMTGCAKEGFGLIEIEDEHQSVQGWKT